MEIFFLKVKLSKFFPLLYLFVIECPHLLRDKAQIILTFILKSQEIQHRSHS